MDANHSASQISVGSADVLRSGAPSPYGPTSFFSATLRIGRRRFLAYCLFVLVLTTAASAGATLALFALGFDAAINPVITIAITGAQFAWWLVLAGRRLRDSDRAAWEFVLLFVPLLNLIVLASPGTPGPNRYGPPPEPTPTWMSATVLALLALMLVFALIDGGLLTAWA